MVSILLMILLWVIYKEKTHWYSSLMCFWFGVIYAKRGDGKIGIFARLILFFVLFAAALLLYAPLTNMDSIGLLVLAMLMNLTAIALASFLFGFFCMWDYHSPIWSFVGKISYEIYLYQGLAMGIVERILDGGNIGSYVIIPCVLVLTLVIALMVNRGTFVCFGKKK